MNLQQGHESEAVKVLNLPWPDADLQSNGRCGWAKKQRLTRDARNAAWAVSMEAPRVQCMPNAHIFIEYYPKTYRGDIHNIPSAMKPYIDGVADAMGCDDKFFTVHYPTEWAGKSTLGKIVFRIVPGEQK